MTAPVVVPAVDPAHEPFWAAAARGELVVQRCRPAGHVLHLPRGYCHRCATFDVTWEPVSGRATVHTWTIVEHTVDPSFPAPYAIVLVELDDVRDVRFVTHLPGRPTLAVGQPMDVRFEPLGAGIVVPHWVPATPGRP